MRARRLGLRFNVFLYSTLDAGIGTKWFKVFLGFWHGVYGGIRKVTVRQWGAVEMVPAAGQQLRALTSYEALRRSFWALRRLTHWVVYWFRYPTSRPVSAGRKPAIPRCIKCTTSMA